MGGLFGKKKEEGKQSDQYGQQCSDECAGGQQQKKPGMVDKIKEKIPGQQKKIPGEGKECCSDQRGGEDQEKKAGLLDKIKDKLPGNQNKNGAGERKEAL